MLHRLTAPAAGCELQRCTQVLSSNAQLSHLLSEVHECAADTLSALKSSSSSSLTATNPDMDQLQESIAEALRESPADAPGEAEKEAALQLLLPNAATLIEDSEGCYALTCLIDICDNRRLLLLVTQLFPAIASASDSSFGNFVIQRLVKRCTLPALSCLIVAALQPEVNQLCMAEYGHHVIESIVKYFQPQYSTFIYEAVLADCLAMCTNRLSSCVVQCCMDHGSHELRARLLAELAMHAQKLVGDPFGNFVLQYGISFGIPDLNMTIAARLKGTFAMLAMSKFASNVLESLLKQGDDGLRSMMLNELMDEHALSTLLRDRYGNYVLQTALRVCNAQTQTALADAIRPYLPSIRALPHYRKLHTLTKALASDSPLQGLSAFRSANSSRTDVSHTTPNAPVTRSVTNAESSTEVNTFGLTHRDGPTHRSDGPTHGPSLRSDGPLTPAIPATNYTPIFFEKEKGKRL